MFNYRKLLSYTFLIIIVNAQTKVWTPEMSIKVKLISDLNFSKDNKIAMVVREALIDEEIKIALEKKFLNNQGKS